jgi:hypothetical protein
MSTRGVVASLESLHSRTRTNLPFQVRLCIFCRRF